MNKGKHCCHVMWPYLDIFKHAPKVKKDCDLFKNHLFLKKVLGAFMVVQVMPTNVNDCKICLEFVQ